MTNAHQASDMKIKLFQAFSDQSRLSILNALKERPLRVNEITEATGLSQSSVFSHLEYLRSCNLVISQHQAGYAFYQLIDTRIAKLLDLTSELLSDVVKGMESCCSYDVSEQD